MLEAHSLAYPRSAVRTRISGSSLARSSNPAANGPGMWLGHAAVYTYSLL